MESKRTEEMLQPSNCIETTQNIPAHRFFNKCKNLFAAIWQTDTRDVKLDSWIRLNRESETVVKGEKKGHLFQFVQIGVEWNTAGSCPQKHTENVSEEKKSPTCENKPYLTHSVDVQRIGLFWQGLNIKPQSTINTVVHIFLLSTLHYSSPYPSPFFMSLFSFIKYFRTFLVCFRVF